MNEMYAGGFAFILVVYACGRVLATRKQIELRSREGLALSLHIKQLIEACQKHRGTSNAVIQGNSQLKPQLAALQAEIDQLITNRLSTLLARFPQWQSFIDHWPRLKKHVTASDLKPHLILRQHHVMIDGQLSLLDDVMRYYDMHQLMLDRCSRVSELCLDTLRAAEIVGQARAIGSGICAKQVCEGADKISLDFLKIAVRTRTDELCSELALVQNPQLVGPLKQFSRSIHDSVNKLVHTIESEVMSPGRTRVDSQAYFRVSTQVIEELLKVFNLVVTYSSEHYSQVR